MTKLYINNIEYPVQDGIIINDKYNEELDSAIVTIPYTDKLALSPFDFVKIEIGDDKKYFLVNTWTDTTVSFSPLKYSYNISLISETIKLQKIVCPNLAITQPIGLTPRTIADKLQQYYEVYIEPQYPELTLSQELLDLCDVECPENMFSRPTMFEVFNTLLSKVNAVVKITNHSIKYLKLDDYGNEIDTTKLYYDNETQNINEYANRLDINVENGVSKKVNHISVDGVTPRTSNNVLLTDDNMEIILEKPIYEIEKVYVYYRVNTVSGSGAYTTISDITDYVVEKSVYDYYYSSNSAGIIRDKGYKRNAIYYTQGSNVISGLGYSEKRWISNSKVAIVNILNNIIGEIDLSNPDDLVLEDEDNIRKHIAFRIEYKTSDNFRLNVIKENTYNATLIDNQSEKQVDTINYGKVEQDKLNRLGNKEKIITATYFNNQTIPQLSDYIDDYILAQRELVIYDDYTLFKGYLYKNFIRKNLYYGLSSKKRFTQISGDFVNRDVIDNYTFTFSSQIPEIPNKYRKLISMLLIPISTGTISLKPHHALFSFYDDNGDAIVNKYVLKNISYYDCGRSNVLVARMNDNYSAGLEITDSVTGGMLQKEAQYTDDYGEFKSYSISIYASSNGDFARQWFDIETTKGISNKLPYISVADWATYFAPYQTSILSKLENNIYKDNREVFGYVANLNFLDTNEVIVGNFSSYTGLITNRLTNVKFCYSLFDKYVSGDTMGLGNAVNMSISTTNYTNWVNNNTSFNSIEFTTDADTSDWVSFGVLDADNNLILGINKIGNNAIATTIYLHISEENY